MENKVPLGEGFMYLDEKKYCFWKRSAADVDITDEKGGNAFTYTPGFGDFKEIDLDQYLIKYVKDNDLKWCDVNIDWCRHCHYEINPETLELGEFLESSGCEGEYLEWNPETQEFTERDDEDEEEEDDDEEED